jgi:predicted homoserine dehydrogenase-like protein
VTCQGQVEFGAEVTLSAFEAGKHVVTMNAELDGTVGPLLKVLAGKAGVLFTGVDGDQPGVEMNLYRFVQGMGLTPLVLGNIKGLQDPTGTRPPKRASPVSGARTRTWSPASPTAPRSRSNRRSSPMRPA